MFHSYKLTHQKHKGKNNPLKKWITGIFYLIWASNIIDAQSPYPFLSLTPNQGLSQNYNAFIYQDSYGFAWISSLDGLNRFDGRNVKIYRPSQDNATSIYGRNMQSDFWEAPNGDLWFVTEEAINQYRRASDNFRHYFISDQSENIQYHAFFLEKKRYLWTLAGKKVYRFDTKKPNGSLKPLFTTDAIRFAVDTTVQGQVEKVYGCYRSLKPGIEALEFDVNYRLKKTSFFFHAQQQEQFPLIVNQIVLTGTSIIWLATDQGLVSFNPYANKYEIFYADDQKRRVRSIALIDKRYLFFSSLKDQLALFDGYQKKIKDAFYLNAPYALDKKYTPNDLYFDRNKILWISSYHHGLFYAHTNNHNFRNVITSFKGKSVKIDHIYQHPNGCIWCVSNLDTSYIYNEKFKTFKKSVLPDYFRLFHNPGLSVFGIGNQSLYALDESMQIRTIKNTNLAALFSARFITSKSIFLGTAEGMKVYDLNNEKLSSIAQANREIETFLYDKHQHLWIASSDFVDVYDKVSLNSARLIKKFPRLGTVRALFEHGDSVWVGTSSGLMAIHSKTFKVAEFNEKSGVNIPYVNSIIMDKQGVLWLGTNQGLTRFDYKNNKIKHFTKSNGLSSEGYLPRAALLSKTGEIWFGGNNGVDVFRPEDIHDVGHAPQLAITKLSIHGAPWRGDSSIEVQKKLVLSYKQNALTFELAAMEYLDPGKNQFKVHLDNYDQGWVSLGTQNFITYPNLPPGRYTFKFTACNAEGIWNHKPRSLSIQITPPYWQTTWFRALLVGIALLIAYGAYRYRIAQIRREYALQEIAQKNEIQAKEKELEALESTIGKLLAQMNPHFVFNGLNSINAFIVNHKSHEAENYLLRFANLMRKTLDFSSKNLIRLDQEIAFLEEYLSIEKLRAGNQFEWRIEISDAVDTFDSEVPPMLLQPFVENAIWHGLSSKSAGGLLLIQFSQTENGDLICVVDDNGVGRKATEKQRRNQATQHESKGQGITFTRLALYDKKYNTLSSFQIDDKLDEQGQACGTKVSLRIGKIDLDLLS